MQTPGLPVSQPTPANRTANNSAFEKPSRAGEQFGDMMNRALNSGTGVPPVRPDSNARHTVAAAARDEDDDHADEKSLAAKSKKPLRRESDSVSANPQAAGIAVPPGPSPTQNQSAVEPDESPKGKADPISADDSNKKVSDADLTETETTKDPATETATAPLDPKMLETTDSVNHAQKTPATAVTEALTAAVEAVDPHSDPTKAVAPDSSDPQSVQITPAKNEHQPMAASPADPRGTSTAKQDITMKKAEKTQKVAGSAEQDLPGSTSTGSEELPHGQKLSAKAAVQGEKPDSTAIELPTRISTSVDSTTPTVTAAAPAPIPGIDSRVLERTHDIVALHAMRLNDTGSDSLRVVVKPGAGIQLSLELRQSARGIEVSAELHKGDFQHLNQHWSDLQQRLEARGVRVSSLTTAENYTGGQHFNQSKQQSSNQDPLYAGAFAEFALAGSMTEAPGARAARASAYRGWETWA